MYKITFTDLIIFSGGNLQDSKWNEVPDDKKIAKLEYFTGDKTLVLENYEAYNHVVERVVFLQNGKSVVGKVILMAKKGQDVLKITYDFKKRKASSDLAIFGKEYRGRPHKGWKKGFVGGKSRTYII